MRMAVAFFAVALGLSACGFQPLHGQAENQYALLAQIDAPQDADGRFFARQLSARLGQTPDAPFSVTAQIDQKSTDSQMDARGVALRQRLDVHVTLSVTRNSDGTAWQRRFTQSGFVALGDSGSADMMRRRAQTELALRRLADQATGFIRRLAREARR